MPSTFQIAAQQKTKQIHIACMQLFVAFECMDFWDTVWINITRNLMRLSTFVSTKCTQCEKNKKKLDQTTNNNQTHTDEGTPYTIYLQNNSLVSYKYAVCININLRMGWTWETMHTAKKERKCKQAILITWIYQSIYKISFECNI